MEEPMYASKTYTDCAKAESPFDQLTNFTKMMQELDTRVSMLADRIVGATPPTPTNATSLGVLSGGDGLMSRLDRDTSTLRSLADGIFNSLARIENRL